MSKIADSELILNNDNSVYHLKLHPHQLAKDIIVVGDPGRVEIISNYFDVIEHKVTNREIITHTGTLNGKRLTAGCVFNCRRRLMQLSVRHRCTSGPFERSRGARPNAH